MKLSHKISVVAATFFLAAATGQYMQSTAGQNAPAVKPVELAAAGKTNMPVKVTRLSALTRTAVPLLSDTSGAPALHAPRMVTPPAEAAIDAMPKGPPTPAPLSTNACVAAHADLSVGGSAMLALTISAPCHALERVVIRHAGLAFTALTDANGTLQLQLPAMAEAAKVSVLFQGGETVSAQTAVPELSLYDRVAVQWIGNDAFSLHGLEFGAEFGAPGDIPAANPGAPGDGSPSAGSGYLTLLGNAKVNLPMRAEVYTYPTRLSSRTGAVHLVIDAAVSQATCGRDMLGETLRTRPNAQPLATDLTVAMPACDAPGGLGGFVELRGVVPDIEVASN